MRVWGRSSGLIRLVKKRITRHSGLAKRRVFAALPGFTRFAARAGFPGFGCAATSTFLAIATITVHAAPIIDTALLTDARTVFVKFQRLDFDFGFNQLFNVSHQALVAVGYKAHRQTRRTSTAGAANAVHIVFGIERHVEVEHCGHVLDVKPASRNIGTDQQIDLTFFKSFEGF